MLISRHRDGDSGILGVDFRIREHFCREGFEGGTAFPGVQWEASLAAGLFQKGDSVPVVLNRNLGEKKAAPPGHGYHQAVPANLDFVRGNGAENGQDAEGDFEVGGLVTFYWLEAAVLRCRRPGGFGDSTKERENREHITDTPTKFAMQV
jgi:hypothetical protein